MDSLRLQGFKCFLDETFNLNKLTLFTGANGAGKSSVIQSLLLIRQVIELLTYSSDNRDSFRTDNEIVLNGYRKLQLGSFDDISHIDADNICISLNGVDCNLQQGQDSNTLKASLAIEDISKLPDFIKNKEFYYLNAERVGPRLESKVQSTSFLECGNCGEWAGNVLLSASRTFPKVEEERLYGKDVINNFNIQVDKWMSYIFSEISIKSEPITSHTCQIKLRGPKVTAITPNTGFGYTYALPIIINGLIAKRGSMFIIENPEAHLHPKAQSNIGFFLGKMAAAGLKIVIETHSEHVVNGIRRAALSQFGLTPEDDISIYFFERNKDKCPYTLISIDEDGNLSEFPVDFFDQVRQDMFEIIQLAQLKKQ